MYAAISGLKAHMNKLNVIGNNIANVNTHGYKAQRYVFHEALYTTSQSGSNGTTRVGGKNPNQIGYGSVTGTIDLDMSTGSSAPGKSSDIMIDGEGFFLVGNKDIEVDPNNPNTLKNFSLTRVGDLSFKADSYYSNEDGNVVYGFLTKGYDKDGNPIVSDQLVPIRYPRMYSKTEEYTVQDYIDFFKENMNEHDLEALIGKFADGKQAYMDAAIKADPTLTANDFEFTDNITDISGIQTLDDVKALLAASKDITMTIPTGKDDGSRQDVLDKNDNPVKYNLTAQYHKSGSPIMPKIFDINDPDMNPYGLTEDQLAPDVAAMIGKLVDGGSQISADGSKIVNDYPYLAMDSITVDDKTGRISGVSKETEEDVIIGYIAIGNVDNPDGVTHTGGPYYRAMDGAGDMTVSLLGGAASDLGIYYVNGSIKAFGNENALDENGNVKENAVDLTGEPLYSAGARIGNAGTTAFMPGGLELSKTDLATEISEMITTQRGYQANTRIVTVTDSMLEELVNMKR